MKKIRREFQQRKIRMWVNNLSFSKIFLLWISIILIFGVIYFIADNSSHELITTDNQMTTHRLQDALYFSFVTATTTGYGDIIPSGVFRVISIVEVLFSLLLFALVTSKLVGIKQDAILEELYELSIHERTFRLRSALLLYRQQMDRLKHAVIDKTITKRDLRLLPSILTGFDDALGDIKKLVLGKKNSYVKQVDQVNIELLTNSVKASLERTASYVEVADNISELSTRMIIRCVNESKSIMQKKYPEEYEIIKESIFSKLEKGRKDS